MNFGKFKIESGDVIYSKWLITAVGCLSAANVPNISGVSRFEGHWYHTGNWPHTDLDFNGLFCALARFWVNWNTGRTRNCQNL